MERDITVLGRRRVHRERLHQGLRFLLRSWLALTMIGDGIVKVIPVQMPFPGASELLLPLGDLAPGQLLWTFLGASPVFQSFAGLAELAGGLLLLVPRTTLLGALICAANLSMAVVVAVCYDLPAKGYLSCLLLMSLVLASPDLRRLGNLFLFNRAVDPAEAPPPLFARKGLDRAPQVLLVLFALIVIGRSLGLAAGQYQKNHPPKPPLHGVWSVEELVVDGEEVPMSTDANRWRWVIFEHPGALDVEPTIGTRQRYPLDLDMKKKTMRLGDLGERGELSFQETEPDVLLLDGQVDGRRTRATLRKMPLVGDRFHWILEPEEEE